MLESLIMARLSSSLTLFAVCAVYFLSVCGSAVADNGTFLRITTSPPDANVTLASIHWDPYWLSVSDPASSKQYYELQKEGIDERVWARTDSPGSVYLPYGSRYVAMLELSGFHTVTVPIDPVTSAVRSWGDTMDIPDRIHVTLVPLSEPAPSNAFDIQTALERIDAITPKLKPYHRRNKRERWRPQTVVNRIDLRKVFPDYVKEIDLLSPEDRCRLRQRRPGSRQSSPLAGCQYIRKRGPQ